MPKIVMAGISQSILRSSPVRTPIKFQIPKSEQTTSNDIIEQNRTIIKQQEQDIEQVKKELSPSVISLRSGNLSRTQLLQLRKQKESLKKAENVLMTSKKQLELEIAMKEPSRASSQSLSNVLSDAKSKVQNKINLLKRRIESYRIKEKKYRKKGNTRLADKYDDRQDEQRSKLSSYLDTMRDLTSSKRTKTFQGIKEFYSGFTSDKARFEKQRTMQKNIYQLKNKLAKQKWEKNNPIVYVSPISGQGFSISPEKAEGLGYIRKRFNRITKRTSIDEPLFKTLNVKSISTKQGNQNIFDLIDNQGMSIRKQTPLDKSISYLEKTYKQTTIPLRPIFSSLLYLKKLYPKKEDKKFKIETSPFTKEDKKFKIETSPFTKEDKSVTELLGLTSLGMGKELKHRNILQSTIKKHELTFVKPLSESKTFKKYIGTPILTTLTRPQDIIFSDKKPTEKIVQDYSKFATSFTDYTASIPTRVVDTHKAKTIEDKWKAWSEKSPSSLMALQSAPIIKPIKDIVESKKIIDELPPEQEIEIGFKSQKRKIKAEIFQNKGLIDFGKDIILTKVEIAEYKSALDFGYTPKQAMKIAKGLRFANEFAPYFIPGYFQTQYGARALESVSGGKFGGAKNYAEFVIENPLESTFILGMGVSKGLKSFYGEPIRLGQPILDRTKIKAPRKSLKVKGLVGAEQDISLFNEHFSKISFPKQKVGQFPSSGYITTVTTGGRQLLKKGLGYINIRLPDKYYYIYQGVPRMNSKGYKKALRLLEKYGYTHSQAKNSLKLHKPRVIDKVVRGEIIGKDKVALGEFDIISTPRVITVDKKLGIKTLGGKPKIKHVKFARTETGKTMIGGRKYTITLEKAIRGEKFKFGQKGLVLDLSSYKGTSLSSSLSSSKSTDGFIKGVGLKHTFIKTPLRIKGDIIKNMKKRKLSVLLKKKFPHDQTIISKSTNVDDAVKIFRPSKIKKTRLSKIFKEATSKKSVEVLKKKQVILLDSKTGSSISQQDSIYSGTGQYELTSYGGGQITQRTLHTSLKAGIKIPPLSSIRTSPLADLIKKEGLSGLSLTAGFLNVLKKGKEITKLESDNKLSLKEGLALESLQKVSAKEGTKTIIETKPATASSVKIINVIDEVQPIIELPIILPPTPQRPIPKIPKKSGEIMEIETKKPQKKVKVRLTKKKQYYIPEARRNNMWVKLSKIGLLKQTALGRGARVVDNTISAQFRIRKTKEGNPKLIDNYYSFNKNKFRDYKIRKGKKIPLTNQFLEKRGKARLDSRGEKEGLTIAKMLKRKGWAGKKKKFVKSKKIIKLKGLI